MTEAPDALPKGPRTPGVWQLLRYTPAPLSFLEKCSARFGDPFTLRFAGYGRFVILSDPEAVRDVFRGAARELHSGEGNEFLAGAVGSTSVLVLDDEPHLEQRRILMPPLKGERMRAFFEAMQAATLEEARAWPLGRPVRMVEPMQRITLRVISQAVLGLAPGPGLEQFERQVNRVLAFSRARYAVVWAKLVPARLLAGSRWLPYFRQMRELDELIFALLAELRRRPAEQRGSSVVADLLAASHTNGAPLSDQEIRDAVVTLLMAGHDTTALALAWTLEQIVPRAEIMARIKDELGRVTSGGPPRAEHLDKLEYLDAAIREALRVRTILPFVVRLTKQRYVAGGREYPPGVVLCPCSHLVHRRPELYPEPHEFRPERFLERRFAGHEFFPFGGGLRTCLGMAFALYEAKVVLGTLLAAVELSRPHGVRSRPVRRGVSIAPDDGAEMIITSRVSSSPR